MIDRLSNTIPSVTIGTTAAASAEILLGPYAGGMLFVPTGETVVTLTWYAAEKPGGTYLLAYDEDNVAITQTVAAGHANAMPSALFGCRAVKAVGDAAGTMAISMKA